MRSSELDPSPRRISDRQRSTANVFFYPSFSIFPCQYHSTNVSHSFTYV